MHFLQSLTPPTPQNSPSTTPYTTDNPQIAVAVIVESSGFGAEYAGPIAAQIMQAGIK